MLRERKPIQRTLDLNVEVRTPLVSVEFAKATLRVTEDEVLADIEECAIRWAFDLSGVESERSYIRIFRKSLIERQQGIRNMDDGSGIDAVLQEIFPKTRVAWRCSEIAREWNCGHTHVHNLVKAGALQKVHKNYQSNESPLITRTNLVAFMKGRLIVP